MKEGRLWSRPAFLGLCLGLGFGLWNLIWTRLYPLADDTVGVLLAFYGPMFAAWAATSFFVARRTGLIWEGSRPGQYLTARRHPRPGINARAARRAWNSYFVAGTKR